MNSKDMSSIYISIFKRKGGEGLFTKIISDTKQYDNLVKLEPNEKGLIIFFSNSEKWFLLTNERIIYKMNGVEIIIFHSEITLVELALEEELKNGISDKSKFTRLRLTSHEKKKYIINIESGKSFNGIYQVLHFIASRNIFW